MRSSLHNGFLGFGFGQGTCVATRLDGLSNFILGKA